MTESFPIHNRLRSLRTALLSHRLDGRGELFQSRDVLREVGDWVSESGFASLHPLFELALEVLGQVIRHDGLGREEALVTVETLLEYVDSALKQVSGDRPQTLGMGEPTAAGPVGDLGATAFRRKPPIEARTPTGYEGPGQREIRLDAEAVDETRLGVILLQMKLVRREDLTRALALQQVTRRRLGDILLAMGILDEFRLRDALGRQRHATLCMAKGLAAGSNCRLELQVADPEMLDQAGRTHPRWPSAS